MEHNDKKKIKTIIIPQGAFDANDTIVLKVPKNISSIPNQMVPPGTYDRRIRAGRRTSSPGQLSPDQQYFQESWRTDKPVSSARNMDQSGVFVEGHRATERAFSYRDQGADQRFHHNMPQRLHNVRGNPKAPFSFRGQSEEVPLQNNTAYRPAETQEVPQRTVEQPYQETPHGEGCWDAELMEKYKQTLLKPNYQSQGYPEGEVNEEYHDYQDY